MWLGPNPGTSIAPEPTETICEGATLIAHDDGSFENAVNWQEEGVTGGPDYYGSWAQHFDSDYVCGARFYLTQLEGFDGAAMTVFVWEATVAPNPGNVLCVIPGVTPPPPAQWPELSAFDVVICCPVEGSHFVGLWPDWPGATAQWFLGANESGLSFGEPRTKIAPGQTEESGWQHPGIWEPFSDIRNLGIREYAGMGIDCDASPAAATSWGAIKALY
ncbi:MAG: hypothetical protein GF355_05515 [Candidatus Eisenbacteria bacterium]|nr:hypothetical protein [Candidatus Eisenbacteria bacterium]